MVTSYLLLISICLEVCEGGSFLQAQNLFALSPPPTHSRRGREQTRTQGCESLRGEGWQDENPAAASSLRWMLSWGQRVPLHGGVGTSAEVPSLCVSMEIAGER